MLVIADSRMPDAAKKTLAEIAEPLWIEPQAGVYESISGHPDIFFCDTKSGLIVAPGLPQTYLEKLQKNKVNVATSSTPVGSKYPQTAIYNAVATADYLIHHIKHTAPEIKNRYAKEKHINVNQAYTRCNLLALTNQHFITSDVGIYKTLTNLNKEVLFINPRQIMLPGHQHGFFGGCCGIYKKQLLICGHPDFLMEKTALHQLAEKAGFNIHSLYYGKLFDVGSLLFV